MKDKINVAELLKDCPCGMELDCTMIEGLEFDGIVDAYFPIRCRRKHPDGGYNVYNFTENGCWTTDDFAKCVIFPKGKTTWEGFHRPFKDGDIIADNHNNIAIYKGKMWYNCTLADYYCGYRNSDNRFLDKPKKDGHFGSIEELHLATEEEKEKLFDAIKANGYKWNAETKTLEKLIEPKFKVGDTIQDLDDYKVEITKVNIDKKYYEYQIIEYLSLPAMGIGIIYFKEQDDWELVPKKFDITTLKPYQKVLFRQNEDCSWFNSFFGFYDKNAKTYPFICCNGFAFKCCIPYEGNEHLLGTTDDCDEYYKTW